MAGRDTRYPGGKMKALIVGIAVAATAVGVWGGTRLMAHHGAPLYEIVPTGPICVHEVCEFTVRNNGTKAGKGTCHVEGQQFEGGPAIRGPEFEVDLKPGESRTFKVAWKKAPQKRYTAGCEPGPTL
jgi:hypothetical protein